MLNDPELNALWQEEVEAMRTRISAMRVALVKALQAALPAGIFLSADPARHVQLHRLCADQVDVLRQEHGIYLIASGRVCVAGLNHGNIAGSQRLRRGLRTLPGQPRRGRTINRDAAGERRVPASE